MSKEKFKAVLLRNSKLRPMLQERVSVARAATNAARLQISALPAGNSQRVALERDLKVFDDEIDGQVVAGAAKPGDAWIAMKEIIPRVTAGAKDIKVRAADAAQAVTMKVTALNKIIAGDRKLVDMRVSRGEMSDLGAQAYRGELAGIEDNLRNTISAGGERDALDQVQAALGALKLKYALPSDDANAALNQKIDELRAVLAQARKTRRSVADDGKAVAIAEEIQSIEQDLDGIVAQASTAAEATQDIATDRLIKRANDALRHATRDARKAGGKADAGTASKATLQALLAVPALAQQLNSAAPDPQGRTPMDHVKAVLASFDDRFAAESSDPDRNTEHNRQGVAMRVVAVVGTAARELARGLNDPALQPLIAKALLKEYEAEMTQALRKKKLIEGDDASRKEEAAAVKRALALAQAMVMDDPVAKLLTGKITFADAVQRIRDMTAFAQDAGAQELPSQMLALLRQQFEMTIGSYSADELATGRAKPDTNQGGTTFPLENLPGELNPDRLLGTDADPDSGLLRQERHTRGNPQHEKLPPIQAVDGPAWGNDGLAFNTEASTLLANLEMAVMAWDAPEPPPPAERIEFERALERLEQQIEQVRAVPEAQQMAALRAISPKLLQKAARQLHKPDDPAFLAGKKMYANPEDDAADRELLEAADVPRYIPAPGLGQAHELGATLDDPNAAARARLVKSYEQVRTKIEALGTPDDGSAEAGQLAALGLDSDRIQGELRALGEKDKAARQGAINQRQYEHLRLLARADADEQAAFLADKGLSVKDWVLAEIASRYGVNAGAAEGLLAAVAQWMKTVPLTITFSASSLFSNPDQDEPTYGSVYTSEVVHSRGQKDLKDVIGRDSKIRPNDDDAATVGITGGKDTNPAKVKVSAAVALCEAGALKVTAASSGDDYARDFRPALVQLAGALEACAAPGDKWVPILRGLADLEPATLVDAGAAEAQVRTVMVEVLKFKARFSTDATWVIDRGRNYMRWRTDKDDREARLDHLAPEDQQIFGAANPNFAELKGGAAGKDKVGVNYYGDCHFLLADAVRSRSAFVMRGVGAVNPVQRMDILMLIHDMLKGGDTTKAYLDTVLLHAKQKDVAISTGLDWEVHLYGGFD